MRIFIFAIALALTSPSLAQNYEPLLDMKDGQTILNLSASERKEIRQDELNAKLSFTADHNDPRILQDTINTAMKNALDKGREYSSLKISTLNYNVYEYDPNRGKRDTAPAPIWRGEQSLLVKGTDSAQVLSFTQTLQDSGFIIKSLGYAVSTALREKTHNDLMEDALKTLKEKAERAGKALGKTKVSFLQIDVDGAPIYAPQPRMMMSSMAEGASLRKVSAPVAAAGYSDITLTVRATTLIQE